MARRDETTDRWLVDPASFAWSSLAPPGLRMGGGTAAVVERIEAGMAPAWIQPIPAPDAPGPLPGARLRFTLGPLPRTASPEFVAATRHDLLPLVEVSWDRIWSAIRNRADFDPDFTVLGESRTSVREAVEALRGVYQGTWVRARFADAMGADILGGRVSARTSAAATFPAPLLANTALGVVCRDPGWNYLVSIAQGIRAVLKYPRGEDLVKNLTTHTGLAHQVAFAAFLEERRLLLDVEAPVGSGEGLHDLTAGTDGAAYDIEVTALTSEDPRGQVEKKLRKKESQLPSLPSRPVVLLVILIEQDRPYESKPYKTYVDSIDHSLLAAFQKVSAVVVGRAFVDAAGGPVKWRFDKFLVNDRAGARASAALLEAIFAPNWGSVTPPEFPIIFSVRLGESGERLWHP